MTDQNRPEDEPQNTPAGANDDTTPVDGSWSAEHPAPAADFGQTRPLPPFQQPAPGATTTAPVRRAGGLTAAVMAGALLVGGAAGVGVEVSTYADQLHGFVALVGLLPASDRALDELAGAVSRAGRS